jgi:predicted small metal-binding protein
VLGPLGHRLDKLVQRRKTIGVMTLAYRCLEAGCDVEIRAADEQALLEAVHAHVAGAHDSFELEEVILDVARRGEDEEDPR